MLQARDNITIRWDWGLNHKRMAYFYFPKDDVDLRLMPGQCFWQLCVVCVFVHICAKILTSTNLENCIDCLMLLY
jgi:hypothetical protein